MAARELDAHERRRHRRYPTPDLRVDYGDGEHFLFAPIENLSAMGIFIRTDRPNVVGTKLVMVFALEGGEERLTLTGEVAWVQAADGGTSPRGMGVRFVGMTPTDRERVLSLVNRVAYS